MKTKYLLALTLAFFVMSTDAQSRWGLRTGLNFDMVGIGLNEALSATQSIFEGAATDDGYHLGFSVVSLLGTNFTSRPVHSMLRIQSFFRVRMTVF